MAVSTSNPVLNFWEALLPTKGASSTGPLTIAVSGSSGLIGTALLRAIDGGSGGGRPIRVLRLVRQGAKGEDVSWDPSTGDVDISKLEGVDAIVHLAGEGVASGSGPLAALGRWDGDKKERILSSRIEGTRTLAQAIRRMKRPPAVFVCSSGVGYYGFDGGDAEFVESCPKGNGFLADVVERWEAEAVQAAGRGCKVVCVRTGVVMAKEGGALAKLLPIFQLGAGGNLGSGSQWFSWVSLRDIVGILLFAVSDPSKLMEGKAGAVAKVNACAPVPCTNAEFTAALGKAIRRPTIFPVPEAVGGALFGEMGQEMLFGGQRAVPKALEEAGYNFQDRTIDAALATLFP